MLRIRHQVLQENDVTKWVACELVNNSLDGSARGHLLSLAKRQRDESRCRWIGEPCHGRKWEW